MRLKDAHKGVGTLLKATHSKCGEVQRRTCHTLRPTDALFFYCIETYNDILGKTKFML